MLLSLLIIFVLLLIMTVAQLACARRDARKFPAPGEIVTIPGAQMHVRRLGEGCPAVVLEAGIAASTLNWSLLQPQLAAFTASYSYDRAGFGWSTGRDSSCSLSRIVDDLHATLAALNIAVPYILVGHSFAGLILPEYARRFAAEIGGIVLVDPLTPEEWIKPTRQQRWMMRRGIWFARIGGVMAALGIVRACLWLLQRGSSSAPRDVLRLFGSKASETVERILRELIKLPPETVRLIRARWSMPRFFWTMAGYIAALPRCSAQVIGKSIPEQIPVTVLSGAHQPESRLKEHAAIAAHSLQGRHLMAANSAHWIHLDQPELITEAVRAMAGRLQSSSAHLPLRGKG